MFVATRIGLPAHTMLGRVAALQDAFLPEPRTSLDPGESRGQHLQRTPGLTVHMAHLSGYNSRHLRIASASAWTSSKKNRSRVWVGPFTVAWQ